MRINGKETILGTLGANAWVIASDAPGRIKEWGMRAQDQGYPVWLCDGTGDQVEIQAAIDAVSAAGGGIVNLSTGTFTFNITTGVDPLQSQLIVKSDVVLEGSGWGTVLTLVNGLTGLAESGIIGTQSNGGAIAYSRATIRDLSIDGNKAGVGSIYNGIVMYNDYDNVVENVLVKDVGGSGIQPYGAGGRHKILNNTVQDSDGGAGIYVDTVTGVIVSGNYVRSNAFYGIWLDLALDTTVTGNIVDGNQYSVGTVRGASNNVISGNVFINDTTGAVLISTSGANTNDNIISNNIIVPAAAAYGVLVGNGATALRTLIDNNSITVTGAAIAVTVQASSTDTVLSNNKISTANGHAVYVAASADRFMGSGNVISATGGHGLAIQNSDYAILENNSITSDNEAVHLENAEYTHILGNKVHGNWGITTDANTHNIIIIGNGLHTTNKVSINAASTGLVVQDNAHYVFPGEIRTYSGSLVAGAVGNAVIAWQNPEAQAVNITGTTRITTGASAAATGKWGVASTVQVVEDCEDVWNEAHPSTCTLTNTTGTLTESGNLLSTGINTLNITGAGTFTFALPSGYTATVANGTATVAPTGAVSDTMVIDSGATTGTITVTVTSVCTNAVNTTYVERGTNCIAFTTTADTDAGDLIATESMGALDISTATHLTFKIRVATAVAANDLAISIDEDAGCASPSFTLNIPAISANSTTLVCLPINGGAAAGATANAIISVGLEYNANPAANTIYLDDIRAITVGTELVAAANLQTTGNIAYATTGPIYMDAKNGTSDTLVMASAAQASTGLVGKWYVNSQGV